jgi:hypothetical protein
MACTAGDFVHSLEERWRRVKVSIARRIGPARHIVVARCKCDETVSMESASGAGQDVHVLEVILKPERRTFGNVDQTLFDGRAMLSIA